jgi:hemerythrin-like domain-containing protein
MANAIKQKPFEVRVAAKEAKAALKGLTGVFMHLMEEHGKISALIKHLESTSLADEQAQAELYFALRSELLAHEKGEHRVIYPVLAQYSETATIAAMHSIDASELEATIVELDALSVESPDWKPAFDSLARLVAAHVDREESDYFPKAQKALGKERADELLYALAASKRG